MRYPTYSEIQNSGGTPEPAYQYVIGVIADWKIEESGDTFDWIPVSLLYARYVERWKKDERNPQICGIIRLLPPQQFGWALRLVFAAAESCVRRFKDRPARGISGLRCGFSLRSPDLSANGLGYDTSKRRKYPPNLGRKKKPRRKKLSAGEN